MKGMCFCLIIFSVGCQPDQKSLIEYPQIGQVFDKHEIDDLDRIITFFNRTICRSENLEGSDVLKCYDLFFKRMKNGEQKGIIEIQIPQQDQEHLLDILNPTTINEIWSKYTIKNKSTVDIEILNLKTVGKYNRFLNEMGKENKNIRQYVESLEAVGEFTPFMVYDVLVNYSEYDVSDKRIQLFIAIHYLTFNKHFSMVNQ